MSKFYHTTLRSSAHVMRKSHGFTLIELLVVIAIIAVLMAILIPSLSRAREQDKRLRCSSNLKSISVGLSLYSESADGKLPANLDAGHPYTTYRGDKVFGHGSGVPNPMKLGLLHFTNIIPDGRTFYCPSGMIDWLKFMNYNDPAPWGTLPQYYNTTMGFNNWVRTGFSYYPQSRKKKVKEVFRNLLQSMQNSIPTRHVLPTAFGIKASYPISASRPTGLNALFGDGHVRFSVTEAAFTDELWGTADEEVRPDTREFQTILDLLRP